MASAVKYVVVDFPGYRGPELFPGQPTWVPIEAKEVGYERNPAMRRLQIPLVLAYGVTIHKSQGLTFSGGCVVDFRQSGGNRPWANMGLAYVGMSRCTDFKRQGFRCLPDIYEFREVLRKEEFRKRSALELRLDMLHDQTVRRVRGAEWGVDDDVRVHVKHIEVAERRPVSDAEVEDLRGMLGARGALVPPRCATSRPRPQLR